MSEKPAAPANKISTRSAGLVSLAVMSSRLLGLVREQVFAALFGASAQMDAFIAAFRAPNLLRDLFAEGALSTAFITTFSEKITKEGDDAAWRLANKVATLAAVFMSLVTLLGIWGAPVITHLMASGFDAVPGKMELTVHLTRIMFPFIALVSLAALVMGMLNAKNVFGMPALSSTFFNIGSILGGVGLAWYLDPHFGTRQYGSGSLVGMAIGVLVGGLLQLTVQFPSLRRVGFHFRPDFAWRDPGVRRILLLMGPAVIAASAVQVNVMVNGNFASHLGNGPVSWLGYAFRLMQLPIGIFGVAIGTVTLPVVSRSAAAGNTAEFRSILAKGMRLAFLLTIPSTIGLVMLARPIIGLIYERRTFTAADTAHTAEALQLYAIGLCAYAGIKVLAPAFYAIGKRNTPMMVSFLSIAVNYGLNELFTFHLGWAHRGLAFSTGLVALTNFALLYLLMRKQVQRLETTHMISTLAKLAFAGGVLALICWGGQHWLLAGWVHQAFLVRVVLLMAIIAVAAVAFFGVALMLRIEELDDVAAIARRKLGRFAKRPAAAS
ncbi:putative peptidoglycan lipid II flippase [Chthoniobacter flavus]|uniref:murein biosynthesis integral membrane protein MurJ n=1 Tax=Chthoniobacter flavus TaxID=191863 RepID=UPI001044830A|nr:murein biosynthesis integral membrane protein MurJ [Chthoniobacter flavus]TCO90904.1 putative peptidoglycan lipid II flippase [Chthoniobacter flavus]